jgi:hypothetical protein
MAGNAMKDGPPGSLVAQAIPPQPSLFTEGGGRRTNARRVSRGRGAQAPTAENEPVRAGRVCEGAELRAAFVASRRLARGVLGLGCS